LVFAAVLALDERLDPSLSIGAETDPRIGVQKVHADSHRRSLIGFFTLWLKGPKLLRKGPLQVANYPSDKHHRETSPKQCFILAIPGESETDETKQQ
jgi:hypothetical protein